MNTRFMSGFALTLAATMTPHTPATSAQAEGLTLTDIARCLYRLPPQCNR